MGSQSVNVEQSTIKMDELTTFITGIIMFLSFAPFLHWLMKKWKYWNIIDRMPGRMAFPIIGTMWDFMGVDKYELFYVMDDRVKMFPNGLHRLWTGSIAEVRIYKAEYVEKILANSVHLEKTFMYNFLKMWLGEGLLTAKNERWHKHRKIITPTYHFNILEKFCDVFFECSEVLTNNLEKFCDTGEAVNVYPAIANCALDIICETAMGTKINAQMDEENEYVKAVHEISYLFMDIQVKRWLHNRWILSRSATGKKFKITLAILHDFTNKVIQERKLAREKEKMENLNSNDMENEYGLKKRLAFLDLLLEGNEKNNLLTDEDIREEVDTFMFEGHDTTTAGINWSLFLIGLHDDVQDKIFEELDSIFQGSDRNATIKDLHEMKYLDRCIKEALRLYPSVSFIGRMTSETIYLDEYEVPAGTTIGIHIYHLHRDERFFPDPEKYDPDRFLPENIADRHPYAYVPFSAGPRNCIGQKFAMFEEKSVISAILRKFKIRSADKREEVRIWHGLISRPRNGIRLFLEKRKT